MNRFKRFAIQSGLMLITTASVLPAYTDTQANNDFTTHHLEYRQDNSPHTTWPHHSSSVYLIPEDSGILNIEHTAFAVIRLKNPLPADVQFSLNGETVNFQKVNTAGTILKSETSNLRNKWLEITGSQIDIRHLLTFKDL